MKAHKQEHVWLITTPDELREMADEMEILWYVSRLGESLARIVVEKGDIQVKLDIDQEEMEPHVRSMKAIDFWKAKLSHMTYEEFCRRMVKYERRLSS